MGSVGMEQVLDGLHSVEKTFLAYLDHCPVDLPMLGLCEEDILHDLQFKNKNAASVTRRSLKNVDYSSPVQLE